MNGVLGGQRCTCEGYWYFFQSACWINFYTLYVGLDHVYFKTREGKLLMCYYLVRIILRNLLHPLKDKYTTPF